MGNTESSLGHAGTLGGRSSASYPLTPRRGPTSAPLQFATFTTLETFRVSNSSLRLDPMGVDDGVGGSGKVSRRKAERKGSRGTATRSSTMNVFARARAKAAKATKQRFRELKGVESVSILSLGLKSPPTYRGILPPKRKQDEGKITVVLDMDETLIHSEFESQNINNYRQKEQRKTAKRKPDFEFNMILESGRRTERVKVFERPGLDKFLNCMAKAFEVVVFTAAIPQYAQPVLNRIDPRGRIAWRLFRDSTCVYNGTPYVKDLTQLGRSMHSIVLVDNNPYAMLACPDNAIPITSYYDSLKDRELDGMMQLLLNLNRYTDVRPPLQKRFKFRKLMDQHCARVKQQQSYATTSSSNHGPQMVNSSDDSDSEQDDI